MILEEKPIPSTRLLPERSTAKARTGRQLPVLLFCLCCVLPSAASASGAKIHLEDKGAGVSIRGEIQIPAPLAVVWSVVTDYNHIAAFTPGVTESRVVGKNPDGSLRLERVSKHRFLFFSRKVRVLLRITQDPMVKTEFSLIKGDFRTYEGSWVLDPTGKEVTLRLTIRMEPDFFAPVFVRDHIARQASKEALEAVRREALRRMKAARKAPPGGNAG